MSNLLSLVLSLWYKGRKKIDLRVRRSEFLMDDLLVILDQVGLVLRKHFPWPLSSSKSNYSRTSLAVTTPSFSCSCCSRFLSSCWLFISPSKSTQRSPIGSSQLFKKTRSTMCDRLFNRRVCPIPPVYFVRVVVICTTHWSFRQIIFVTVI